MPTSNQHALAVPVSCGHPVVLLSHCLQILTQHTGLLDCLVPLQSHTGQLCLQPLNLTVKLTLQLALLVLNCQKRPRQMPQTALQTPIGLHHGKHSTHSSTITVLILIHTPLQSIHLGLISHQSVGVTPRKHPSEGVGQLPRKPLHDVPQNCKSSPVDAQESLPQSPSPSCSRFQQQRGSLPSGYPIELSTLHSKVGIPNSPRNLLL